MPLVQENTYGGLFKARTGRGLDLDRDIITGLGFTILAEEPRAGETHVFVHCGIDTLNAIVADYDLKISLPGWFFPLPVGEELTLTLVKDWTARANLFFS